MTRDTASQHIHNTPASPASSCHTIAFDYVKLMLWVCGVVVTLIAGLSTLGVHTNIAHAQCIPGLPCDTPKTSNNPYDGPISPNEGGPNASKTTSDACDADFMNQIYSRAFIEAERENLLNEVLIRKPDSVMEYTCFDQLVSATAGPGGERFSDSDHWNDSTAVIDGLLVDEYINTVPIDVFMCNDTGNNPCDKLDKSLEDLVLIALKEYVDTNFDHDFLGGKEVGVDAEIGDSIRDFYLCDYMNNTHFLAKCNDMITDDQFYSFDTLVGLDPRILPEQCEGGTEITQERIDIANNEGFQYADFDEVDPLLSLTRDSTCASPPIPVGIDVILDIPLVTLIGRIFSYELKYEDHVCPNAGCWYNPNEKKCE